MSKTIKITGFVASLVTIFAFVINLNAEKRINSFTNNGSVGTVNQADTLNNTTNNYYGNEGNSKRYFVSDFRALCRTNNPISLQMICGLSKGIEIQLIEEQMNMTKVKVLDGSCINTVGWLDSSAIEKR